MNNNNSILKDKTDLIKDIEMIEENEMTEEFLAEPYYKYDSFDIEKVEKVALELGFRKNTQKLADSLRVVSWIEEKLQKLGKMESKTVEYDLERFGFEGKGEMLVFGQCVTLFTGVIAKDLGISFYRAKKAKELLSRVGLIRFLKTIKTSEGKFLKLWVVELEYYGNEIIENDFDLCGISAEEAERDKKLLEEYAEQIAILDDFMEGVIGAEECADQILDDITDENDDFVKDFDSFEDSSDVRIIIFQILATLGVIKMKKELKVSLGSSDNLGIIDDFCENYLMEKCEKLFKNFADIDINNNFKDGEVKMEKENKDFKVSIDSDEDLKTIDDFYDNYIIEKLFSKNAGKSGLS